MFCILKKKDMDFKFCTVQNNNILHTMNLCTIIRKATNSNWCVTKGVFTPGKSTSSLALVRTKYNVDFYCLVWYVYTLSFVQVNQKLWTKPDMCLRSSIHWFIHSTVPEFVLNGAETASSAGPRFGCLVRTQVRLLYSHQPKRSEPRGETNLSLIQ